MSVYRLIPDKFPSVYRCDYLEILLTVNIV